jgi:hypothetical protein
MLLDGREGIERIKEEVGAVRMTEDIEQEGKANVLRI